MSRPPAMVKRYLDEHVLGAARARVAWVFNNFRRVVVSVSGGKDSSVLYHLARAEAERRGRQIHAFFLDQEAEYQGTVEVVREMMHHPAVVPCWYQVPLRMTNATSYEVDQLHAWGPGEEWMREKEPDSIQVVEGDYPDRFYDFFPWMETQQPKGTAFLVGLRAEEGINRFRAVTKHPGVEGVPWSTKTALADSFKLYPLYDWGMGDIWKYIADEHVSYNRIYDLRFAMGCGIYNDNRVSNLIHEMSFRCLPELAALEPDTYARLVRRLKGVHCAARHAGGPHIYDARELPEAFPTWLAYRDYLLGSLPIDEAKRSKFARRFKGQGDDERVCQAHCKRLLIGDHENNVPVTTTAAAARKKPDHFARWRKVW